MSQEEVVSFLDRASHETASTPYDVKLPDGIEAFDPSQAYGMFEECIRPGVCVGRNDAEALKRARTVEARVKASAAALGAGAVMWEIAAAFAETGIGHIAKKMGLPDEDYDEARNALRAARASRIAVSYGPNAIKKLRSHWGDIRKLAKEQGFEMPRKFKNAEGEIKDFIASVTQTGVEMIGPYKPTGGGGYNMIWTKKGNTVIIRQPSGQFLTILDASKGGAAKNFPGGL